MEVLILLRANARKART
uniref:Uncharacterized protein n=1 Tax=Anguilla anguilla TaxID=7936 RepID=A0A0E9TCX8_ANGAN